MDLYRDPAQTPEFEKLIRQLAESRHPVPLQNAREASPAGVKPSSVKCEGDLYIGLFFDGTGNNKDADYGPEDNPKPFLERKHSNIVRLFHAFPDELDKIRENKDKSDTNQFYRFYIPGVGTPFKEVGDTGEGITGAFLQGLGGAAGKGGEARLLWAMIQVLNAVNSFYKGPETQLISDAEALSIINMVDHEGREKTRKVLPLDAARVVVDGVQLYKLFSTDNNLRKSTFKALIARLRAAIPKGRKPELRRICIYSFGFSRGAAEARAFINWLLDLCRDEVYGLGLISPFDLYFPFLGILDTVASVGMASMWSLHEGHSSWGDQTQEIPPEVGRCVHMVAAHEIRACFPLDSVRVNGKYPGNVEEIVYPGAHSDIGGGYALGALGKADVGDCNTPDREGSGENGADLQIARTVGFDMYLRALEYVPFYTMAQLEEQGRPEIAEDLRPGLPALLALKRYVETANVPAGPVEEQLKQHTGLYLHWRWKQGEDYLQGVECSRLMGKITHNDTIKHIEETEKKIEKLRKEIDEKKKKLDDFGWGSPTDQARQKKMIVLRKEIATLEEQKRYFQWKLEANREEYHPLYNNVMDGVNALIRTQKELIRVIVAYSDEIDARLPGIYGYYGPLENPLSTPGHKVKIILSSFGPTSPFYPLPKEEWGQIKLDKYLMEAYRDNYYEMTKVREPTDRDWKWAEQWGLYKADALRNAEALKKRNATQEEQGA